MAATPRSRPRPAVVSARRLVAAHARSLTRPAAVGVAFALLGVGAYALARATSAFAIRAVEVEGAPRPLARDVRRALTPLTGRSLVGLDGDAVTARLAALPGVRSAEYDRAFPNTLVVFVLAEPPAAVVRAGSASWLVSARGRVLRRVERTASRRLPRVWLPARTPAEPGATLGDPRALTALRAAAAAHLERFPHRVFAIRAAGEHLVFGLARGRELRLGEPADLPLKLAVANAVLRRLPPVDAGGPTYVDVSNPERVVAGGTLKSKVELESSAEQMP